MSGPGFTPLPWTVGHFVRDDVHASDYKPQEMGLYEIEEANEQINAYVREDRGDLALKEAEANRALIQAAPALYDALEAARGIVLLNKRTDPCIPAYGTGDFNHYMRGYECAVDDYRRTVDAAVAEALKLARGEP